VNRNLLGSVCLNPARPSRNPLGPCESGPRLGRCSPGLGLLRRLECRWNFTKDVRSSRMLEAIRQQIEQFDTIEAIDPEMRGIVERNWPRLLVRLPPKDDDVED
jgi:hypothetical protein